jgi:glutamyl-tRNA reductase
MNLLLVGLNHHTAPVEIRERLAFGNEDVETALVLFAERFPDCEAAILSTCNRVEMLVAGESDAPRAADVVSFLALARDLPVDSFEPHLYKLTAQEAVDHLFRVASGLDSMILGEYQIVNQVKHAYAQACEQGTAGRILNRLFHHAFAVSKRIRTETGIGLRKTSVASIAADAARGVFGDLGGKRVLIVGAGEMAQLTCQYLRSAGAKDFTIVTRTLANAKVLAENCCGIAAPLEELDIRLAQADVVVTATNCPEPFLTVDRLRVARGQDRRPMAVIDLAVPRNVEPGVARLEGVSLYDVDALGGILADPGAPGRDGQLRKCQGILAEETAAFQEWLGLAEVGPLIEMMYNDARQLKDAELRRFFARCPDLTPRQFKEIQQLAERLISKFMHPCVSTLRRHSVSHPTNTLAETFHELTLKTCRPSE